MNINVKSTLFRAWINQASKVSQVFKFDYDDMISRNGGRPMFKPLLLVVRTLGFRVRQSTLRVLWYFIKQIHRIWKHQGNAGLILYLKSAHITLMRTSGGYVFKGSSEPRISRSGSGLPRIIPLIHRRRIEKGDERIVRLWLSLLALYRVLKSSYDIGKSIKSIFEDTSWSSKKDSERQEYLSELTNQEYISWFYRQFRLEEFHGHLFRVLRFHETVPKEFGDVKPFPISKSAPYTFGDKSVSTSFETLIRQAHSLEKLGLAKEIDRYLLGYEEKHRDAQFRYAEYIRNFSQMGFKHLMNEPKTLLSLPFGDEDPNSKEYGPVAIVGKADKWFVGKLGFKFEPAGKLRLFAMVDAWTQWVLKPLHDYIFRRLRDIRMDGTFDQLRPIKSLISFDYKRYYSFDLSSATDRLPVDLQQKILTPLLGDWRATAWKNLLVNRWYRFKVPGFLANSVIRENIGSVLVDGKFEKVDRPIVASAWQSHFAVKYRVGQPMGALSSWAMLALTHHYIIQYCWHKLGNRHLFEDYAVLGDDVVIANPSVAKLYLNVMKNLGLEINKSKSLISAHSLEFAKKFFFHKKDASPFAFKELNGIGTNLFSIRDFVRKWSLDFPFIFHLCGFGYHFLGTYRTKRIISLGPQARASILFYLKSLVSIREWYTSITISKRFVLSLDNQKLVCRQLWYLYGSLIEERIAKDSKKIKRITEEYLFPESWKAYLYTSMIGQTILDTNELVKPIQFCLRDEETFEEAWVNLGFDGVVNWLHDKLREIQGCPDFRSPFTRGVEKSKDDLVTKVFSQEVAIWMAIHVYISNLTTNVQKVDIDADHDTAIGPSETLEDRIPPSPLMEETGYRKLWHAIIGEILLSWKVEWLLVKWDKMVERVDKTGVVIVKKPMVKTPMVRIIRKVKVSNFFDMSYPYGIPHTVLTGILWWIYRPLDLLRSVYYRFLYYSKEILKRLSIIFSSFRVYIIPRARSSLVRSRNTIYYIYSEAAVLMRRRIITIYLPYIKREVREYLLLVVTFFAVLLLFILLERIFGSPLPVVDLQQSSDPPLIRHIEEAVDGVSNWIRILLVIAIIALIGYIFLPAMMPTRTLEIGTSADSTENLEVLSDASDLLLEVNAEGGVTGRALSADDYVSSLFSNASDEITGRVLSYVNQATQTDSGSLEMSGRLDNVGTSTASRALDTGSTDVDTSVAELFASRYNSIASGWTAYDSEDIYMQYSPTSVGGPQVYDTFDVGWEINSQIPGVIVLQSQDRPYSEGTSDIVFDLVTSLF